MTAASCAPSSDQLAGLALPESQLQAEAATAEKPVTSERVSNRAATEAVVSRFADAACFHQGIGASTCWPTTSTFRWETNSMSLLTPSTSKPIVLNGLIA